MCIISTCCETRTLWFLPRQHQPTPSHDLAPSLGLYVEVVYRGHGGMKEGVIHEAARAPGGPAAPLHGCANVCALYRALCQFNFAHFQTLHTTIPRHQAKRSRRGLPRMCRGHRHTSCDSACGQTRAGTTYVTPQATATPWYYTANTQSPIPVHVHVHVPLG